MALVEGLAEVVDLGFFGGSANIKGVDNEDGFGHQCFHGKAETAKTAADV